jgi:hypothetical protein
MSEEAADTRTRRFGRKAAAVLVLLVAAWLLFHLLFGFVIFVATILAVVVAVAAGIWAVRELF